MYIYIHKILICTFTNLSNMYIYEFNIPMRKPLNLIHVPSCWSNWEGEGWCLIYAQYQHDGTCIVYIWDMGWLRLAGSLKWHVSFAKEPYRRDYILQKRPVIYWSLLVVATPYHGSVMCLWDGGDVCCVYVMCLWDS